MTLTEKLYMHNLEIAEKNKTLSLLGNLYEISIQTLAPDALAREITETVQASFECERVEMLSYQRVVNTITTLAYAESKRFQEAHATEVGSFFDQKVIRDISHNTVIEQIISDKKMHATQDFMSMWAGNLTEKQLQKIQAEGHARSFIAFPLIIGAEIIGFFTIILNRSYDQLSDSEKESLQSVTNVIAVALDKARLYEELSVTNKKLADANDRLKELDQLKNEFLSVASHQLRAPITAIKGYVANMLEQSYGEVPEYLKEPLGVVQESTRIMITSIEDYLNVSRIEQGRMKYEMGPVPVVQLAKRAVEELKPLAETKGLVLSFVDTPDVVITADFGKTKQVFTNLIDNAIKYTEKGSVTVSVTQEGDKVRFMTSDTGIGIAADEIDGLFQKFTRARDANSVNTTGTGLGLYVAKSLVEGQGGTVHVESDGKGKGSRFIVELPLVAVTQPTPTPTV